MAITFTHLNAAAGRPMKWPTYLTVCADSVITDTVPVQRCGSMDLTMLNVDDDDVIRAHVTSYDVRECQTGSYILSHAYAATKPFHVHIPHENAARFLPEDIDGTDPSCQTMTCTAPLLNGIGVVRDVSGDRRRATICGLSYMGENGWRPYELRTLVDDKDDNPQKQVPRPYSLVSFHGTLVKMAKDGVLEVDLHRVSYLQPAYSLLLVELDICADVAGRDRATLAFQHLNRDQEKVERLLRTAAEAKTRKRARRASLSSSSVDSVDDEPRSKVTHIEK
ncbi:hypothetical protein OC844_006171 [Tilletia horrida]|nr:hypothetical protein OC844_006171 [Tilletia horrida]